MAQISCKNLEIGYDGKSITGEITFSVEKGDYMCVVGENGAGKSTFMRTVLGLLPPVKGKITFGDGVKENEIGYLPQQTVIQKDFPASVREIVLSGCQNHRGLRPYYNRKEKEYAAMMMEKLQIMSLADRCYRELSGGQQQRVLLARALCATKKILLLDEPVSGLDPKMTEEMYHLIWKLNQEEKITIVMISHDMKGTMRYARHILYMGDSVFWGTTEKFLESVIYKKFSNLTGEVR